MMRPDSGGKTCGTNVELPVGMKSLVILGAGTGGTVLANRMHRQLGRDWRVVVIDPERAHFYQPGLLFIPFGGPTDLTRPRAKTLAHGIEWIRDEVTGVDPAAKTVSLKSGAKERYDFLVIASGSRIRPDLTEGLTGDGWRQSAFDFYSLDGAVALRDALARFEGGRVVVNVVEMPIKCPVAPLEFSFLLDDFLGRRGIRAKSEITYVTPLDSAFTRPLCAQRLSWLLDAKNIEVRTEFSTGSVDGARGVIASYDGKEIPYDLLVTIPTHSGAPFVETSGLGNELAFVPTEKFTLAAKGLKDVFVMGDATDLPSSKAGSVAHFQSELLAENLKHAIDGRPLDPSFDGHSNCFVETGHGKAMLIDFNYDTDPLPGVFPLPGIGPMPLMKEARRNHWAKLAFQWVYWHGLLPARPLPFPARMSMRGKTPVAPSPSIHAPAR